MGIEREYGKNNQEDAKEFIEHKSEMSVLPEKDQESLSNKV